MNERDWMPGGTAGHWPTVMPVGLVQNPHPELQPGGSFMNVQLAADWCLEMARSTLGTDADRVAFAEAAYRLTMVMRGEVERLSGGRLELSKKFRDALLNRCLGEVLNLEK